VEDHQRLLPRIAGGVDIPGGEVSVSHVDQDHGLGVAVAAVPEEVDSVPAADDGRVVVAELVVGIAKAVPGVGLPLRVVEILEQGERLSAGGQGTPVVAELAVVPAEGVEGWRLPLPLPSGQEQVKLLPCILDGLDMPALPVQHHGEAVPGVGLPTQVGGLLVQVESVPQLRVGLIDAAQPAVGPGEDSAGRGLRQRVADPVGRGHAERPVAAQSSQWPRRSRKSSRVQASCQVWVTNPVLAAWCTAASSPACFGGEPFKGLPVVDEVFRGDPGWVLPG
jgi:hypothetical protein